MSALVESLLIILSVSLSYLWLTSPDLHPYSLQLTALFFVAYFVAKRFQRAGWHHILPSSETFQAALLTAGLTLVVGATGGLNSPFLPLFHLLLFVAALSLGMWANLVEMSTLTVFLWAISTHPLTNANTISLLSLPFLLPLMIFARMQFEEAQTERALLKKNNSEEEKTQRYLKNFLVPKLQAVRESLSMSHNNTPLVQKQLALLENETNRLIEENTPNHEQTVE